MSESALLKAVRDEIRSIADYQDVEVNVELDENAPPTAGQMYILVMSAGTEAGPSHNTNQGARDRIYNVDIAIAMRAPRLPRDRQRNLFLDLVRSFEVHERNILDEVDFAYAVNTAADAYILDETGSAEGFIEALKFANTGPFRPAPPSLFAATTGETVAAFIRPMHFRGARRIESRTLPT